MGLFRAKTSTVLGLTAAALLGCSASGGGGEAPGGSGGASGAGAVGGSAGSSLFDSGSSGGSSGSSGGSSGSSGDSGNCGSQELPSDVTTVDVPGNVLVIFDRSDSMNSDFATPNGNQPKYVAAGDALIAAVQPIASQLTVGAILFPSSSTLALCSAVVDSIWSPSQINFKPGPEFVTAWQTYWQNNVLVLGTPLNRAFDRADEAISQSGLAGKTVVVLFTDGEPVCTDGMPAPQRAAQWLSQGIETYVVGLPGAASSTLLNDIAVQGGTGAFLLPADSAQLEQELSQIASKTVTTAIDNCTIVLTPPPPNPNDVHLVVVDALSGTEYEVAHDDGNGNGWTLSPDGKTATLTGTLCDDAKGGRFASVRFEFGCVDLPPLPR